VPGLSAASESVYAAVFRAALAGAADPSVYVRDPDLLRPLVRDRSWEGDAATALAAMALSLDWSVRCPAVMGMARVGAWPGTGGAATRALDLLMAIEAALASYGETVKVDVITRTFTVERSSE
jgi:hypothetical protein